MKLFCGLVLSASAYKGTRIIGGAPATPYSEPHNLSIQQNRNHVCGGVIISTTHGLSAAHCSLSSNQIGAMAGINNIKNNEEENRQMQRLVFKSHELFNSNTLQYDIALLRFQNPFNFNQYVAAIATPEPQEGEWLEHDTPIRICGWGNTQMVGTVYPGPLNCANTHVVDHDTCNSSESYNGAILNGMFCAGDYDDGGVDSCTGDSGGPATMDFGGEVAPTLAGIISWSYACAYPKYPGVYTDVARYMDWVNFNIEIDGGL